MTSDEETCDIKIVDLKKVMKLCSFEIFYFNSYRVSNNHFNTRSVSNNTK